MRKICPVCNTKPVAINYTKNNIVHYRSKCDVCTRKNRKIVPKWVKVGYKKKAVCECCNFKAVFPEQLDVCYLDGDQTNTALTNLKTVCLLCYVPIVTLHLGWQFKSRKIEADI